MAASSGILLLLLLVSPCPLLELACSLLACPFIFTCPVSCAPPFVSPDAQASLQLFPQVRLTRRLQVCPIQLHPAEQASPAKVAFSDARPLYLQTAHCIL